MSPVHIYNDWHNEIVIPEYEVSQFIGETTTISGNNEPLFYAENVSNINLYDNPGINEEIDRINKLLNAEKKKVFPSINKNYLKLLD